MKYKSNTKYTSATMCYFKMCELEGRTKSGITNKVMIGFSQTVRK
jgi:hypothetical protein